MTDFVVTVAIIAFVALGLGTGEYNLEWALTMMMLFAVYQKLSDLEKNND